MTYVFSQDFTVFGGSLCETHAKKICKIMELAMQNGAPVIGLERLRRRAHPGRRRFARRLCRRVPAQRRWPPAPCRRFRVIMGPTAGGAVYSPAMTDFIFMVRDTSLHVRHRPGRGEDRDLRDRDARRAGRRRHPHQDQLRRRCRLRERHRDAARSPPPVRFPAAQRQREAAPRRDHSTPSSARSRARHHHPRQRQQALRHARSRCCRSPTRAISSSCRRTTPATSSPASSG